MENRGIFGVVNISRNSERWAAGATNELDRYVRRVSNRGFVAQSAGNNRVDACGVAYGPVNTQDGIVVVGGFDHDGRQAIGFDNRVAYGAAQPIEPGSNWGNCVEVWGPSQQILSTWSTSATATMRLSGTSMAAPHIAALAARFGTTATTPLEREHHIRSRTVSTGFLDQNNASIIYPLFTSAPGYTLPSKITPNYAFSNYTSPGSFDSCTFDAVYLNCNWNAGATSGWINFVLGSPRTITALRVIPEAFPTTGTATHYVYVDTQHTASTLVATITGARHNILEPFVISLPNVYGSSVRIESYTNGSWLSWREVEIYGQ